jgi:hypothetical protein
MFDALTYDRVLSILADHDISIMDYLIDADDFDIDFQDLDASVLESNVLEFLGY